MNDVTVVGLTEPQDYVKDYFVGDGVSLKFYLSQNPFSRPGRTLVDEEYAGTALDPTRWNAADPANALTVSNGKSQVAGGTGRDGQSTVLFSEKIELGECWCCSMVTLLSTQPRMGCSAVCIPMAFRSRNAWQVSGSHRTVENQQFAPW